MSDTNPAPDPDLPNFTRLAFEAAPVAIALTENRVIRICNQTFGQLFGYDVSELIGRSFRLFYGSDEEFELIRDIGLTVLRETGHYHDERLVRHRKGHNVWCRFRATTLAMDAPLDRIVMSFAPISDTGPLSLSRRERQVLELISRGLTSKEIARHLGLSPRTIDDVRGRLIRRFEVRHAANIIPFLSGRT